MVVQAAPVTSSRVVVAVDVGKTEFAFSVTNATRAALLKPRTGCPMTGPSLAQVIADIIEVLPVDAVVKVGIEAAGHYHRPLLNAGGRSVGRCLSSTLVMSPSSRGCWASARSRLM